MIFFFNYCSVGQVEVRDSSFIVQDCFSYLKFLFIHMKLRIALSRSVNNGVGVLMGIALNL